MKTIALSDTTLRDGEQMPGAYLRPEDKVEIAQALAAAGIDSLEGGFPAMGAGEIDTIRRIVQAIPATLVMALARAREDDIDAALEALQDARPYRRAVSIFIGTSPTHRKAKLGLDKAAILATIERTVRYARERFEIVSFSPEDATRTETDFLLECYRSAVAAGALVIGFPDTLGVLVPADAAERVRQIVAAGAPARVAVHFHDDLGLATANSLAAIEAGAHIVQCTVNGIGERAGNAALEEVALLLTLNRERYGAVRLDLAKLRELSRLVAERSGVAVAVHKAVVGRNAFLTSAGVHQDGILKDAGTYEPYAPALVGAEPTRLVLGRHSGSAAIATRLEAFGLPSGAGEVARVRAALALRRDLDDDEEHAFLKEAANGAPQRHDLHVHYSAEEYDAYSERSLAAYDQFLLHRMRSELAARPGARSLIDIGTGTGQFLFKAARDPAFDRLRLVGTDLFEDMLEIARARLRESGLEARVSLAIEDVHAMSFPDASFDLAMSRATIGHWRDPVLALREIDRILAPGGVAIVHDVRRDTTPEALAEFNRSREAAGVDPSVIDEKYTLAEIRAFADAAGLGKRALLTTAQTGFAALGFELRIRKG
jgi:2-isopropylmalate synthase